MIHALFFNDTATTEIYTLSLHDALPICFRPNAAANSCPATGFTSTGGCRSSRATASSVSGCAVRGIATPARPASAPRSEEHTSELQSRQYLVCRLLLEKKKQTHGTLHGDHERKVHTRPQHLRRAVQGDITQCVAVHSRLGGRACVGSKRGSVKTSRGNK